MGTATTPTGTTIGADELLAHLVDVAERLASLPPSSPTDGSQDAWAEVVRTTQRVVNTAAALQDEAIVNLAAIELFEHDDGTLQQAHKAPGHVALDAGALVSGALDVSAEHAERRVRSAVRLAADGPAGTSTCTGLGALHDAMRSGALDHYRAGVVSTELEEAPPEVAEAVIASLGEHLTRETGPQLRRRCRRLLARISPDLLRQRAVRARSECSLRRWVAEPGVDQWEATFPSEDAARAWGAIDRRAQALVADGTHDRIDRARAQALIDLVMNSATVTTVLTIAVPDDDPRLEEGAAKPRSATAASPDLAQLPTPTTRSGTTPSPDLARLLPPTIPSQVSTASAPDDLVEVPNPLGGEPMLVARTWVDALLAETTTVVRPAPCDPVTGALRSPVTTAAYRPPDALAERIRRRDGRCRFPGCSVAARFCDLDHVRPWPLGPTADDNLVCLCRRHHRIKQRLGWRVTLHDDASVSWADPTGRQRTTAPVDHLHQIVLPAGATTDPTIPENAAPDVGRDPAERRHTRHPGHGTDRHSDLEFVLEHLAGSSTTRGRQRSHRTHRTVEVVATEALEVDAVPRACRRRSRVRQDPWPDEPPF